MRVEQRIGRIDRIGGRPRVEVTNLFYKDTIEEQVYRGISASHGGFTWIVGPAQPVLADLERRIREHELDLNWSTRTVSPRSTTSASSTSKIRSQGLSRTCKQRSRRPRPSR